MSEHRSASERFIALAIKQALLGQPSPNPRVGAVIAIGDEIVSRGFHARAGQAHAEVDAIHKSKGKTKGATLYVTLEPCNHHGRTGPCTDAIIEAKIARVVIGCRDPLPHLPGSLEKLRSSNIEVEAGVLEERCQDLIAGFVKHHGSGLPLVTLKAAMTLDGHMATRIGDSKWITGQEARKEAHAMRAQSDAVLVGVGTVIADDPELSVRHVDGFQPIRVVLDSELRTPVHSKLVTDASRQPTWIFHSNAASRDRIEALSAFEVELISVPNAETGVSLPEVLAELGRRDVVRLLVEGGPHIHGAFMDQHLADRAALFFAPAFIGDAQAPTFAYGRGVDMVENAQRLSGMTSTMLGDDLLVMGQFLR